MFSRSPKDAVRTAVFIGGKDAGLALDMMERLRATLLKPFEISAFADPAGSFTTAAAMVACVEKLLKKKKNKSLAGNEDSDLRRDWRRRLRRRRHRCARRRRR